MITSVTAGGVAALRVFGDPGMPAVTGAVLTVMIVVGALCWIIADAKRTERLTRLIRAARSARDGRRVPPAPSDQPSTTSRVVSPGQTVRVKSTGLPRRSS